MRALGAILLTILIVVSCSPDNKISTDPYHAVPSNASMILEINDITDALEDFKGTRFYEISDSITPFQRWKTTLSDLEEAIAGEALDAFLKDKRMILSVALSGAEKYDLLVITTSSPEFEQHLGQRFSENFTAEQREYSGEKIFHFHRDEPKTSYFVSSYRELLLFSESKTLVEEAIRQVNTEFSIRDEAGFQKLYRTANRKDPANLYLNFQEATPMLQRILPGAGLEFMPRLGNWLELDLQLFEKELLISGISVLDGSGDSYLSAFSECDGSVSKGSAVVPDGFGGWLAINFENAEQYYRSYEHYLEKKGRLRKHQQLLEKLPKDAREHLLNWVDDEMGLIILPGKAAAPIHVAYLRARDGKDATAALDSVADGAFIEGYRGVIIRKMALENALPRVYGGIFDKFHHPYFFTHEDFVIFSESLAGMKGLINDILDEKTLYHSASYKSFISHLPDRSNIKAVAGNPAGLDLLAGLVPESHQRQYATYKKNLESFQFAALQMNIEDQAAYTNFYLQSAVKEAEKVSRVWSTGLDGKVIGEPKFILDHNSRKYDIAVQDENNRLYLVDRQGKILWKRDLDGPIMGEIRQVDAFRNKKLQMIFNTANSLYMLDRLGRDVENFPVKLSAECTAPVAVLDYDNNRSYRLLLAQGKILSNLDIEGKKVKGWAFEDAPANIVRMAQHFSVAGKDIIVAQCADGTLLQLNRRGQERFKSIKGLPVFRDEFYLVEGSKLSESELIAVGDDGMLYSVKPGGSTDKVYLDQDYPADDLFYFEGRYIFSSGSALIVKDEDKPWREEFDSDISQAPKAMILKGKFYAAAFSHAAEEIRLFNNEGELISGFPVFAQGTFDMGSLNLDGSINIVTSSNDGTLICYRVN